jgi:flagellar biosynthetic protein FliP
VINFLHRWFGGWRLLIAVLLTTALVGGEAVVPLPLVPPPLVTAAGTTTTAATVTTGGKDATLKTPETGKFNVGGLTIAIDQPQGTGGMSTAVSLLLLITVLAVAPSFMMMVTSFTRIIIVLGFLRRALGTQTLPPNQVMVGLALFLTLFIMTPTIDRINREAVQPFMAEQITQQAALDNAKSAVRDFMIKHTRKNDLALFIRLAKEERPNTVADVSFTTLVPAFITSELKTAFQMGFIIFLPFLVIDLVVSAVLMALGMMMLPPVVVSLPFKILVFVLVDGWVLLMQGLVASYA